MSTVSHFSDPAQAEIGGKDVIVFDAECVLCSGFFSLILKNDTSQRFHFATAQSELGQQMYRDLGLPTDDFETNLVITEDKVHQRLDAFCNAMLKIRWPWPAFAILRLLPSVIKDVFYHRIARNRHAIFGRYETCLVPEPELRSRFLPDGFLNG